MAAIFEFSLLVRNSFVCSSFKLSMGLISVQLNSVKTFYKHSLTPCCWRTSTEFLENTWPTVLTLSVSERIKVDQHNLWVVRRIPATFPPTGVTSVPSSNGWTFPL